MNKIRQDGRSLNYITAAYDFHRLQFFSLVRQNSTISKISRAPPIKYHFPNMKKLIKINAGLQKNTVIESFFSMPSDVFLRLMQVERHFYVRFR